MAGQTRIDGNLIDTGTDPNDIVSVSVGDARYPRLSQDNTLAGNLTVDGDLNLVATGAGTGVFTIAAPDSNTNRTLTLPDEAGTVLTDVGVPSSALPAGSVIQVVQGQFVSYFTTSSTSFVDVTGFNVSITPSSTANKILIMVSTSFFSPDNNFTSSEIRVILNGNAFGGTSSDARMWNSNHNTGFGGQAQVVETKYLHSPSSTSSQTYQVQLRTRNGATAIGRDWNGDDSGMHTIIAMEIAG